MGTTPVCLCPIGALSCTLNFYGSGSPNIASSKLDKCYTLDTESTQDVEQLCETSAKPASIANDVSVPLFW